MSLVPGMERAEPPATADPAGGEAGSGQRPVRILVVDDNPDSTALLVAVLEAQSYTVETATTGQAALSSVAANPPALMLLDVMLPDLDGHEVARRVKYDANLPFIPVILVTAKSELRDKIYGLEQGADDFLSKPVNSAELMARVHSLLRLKRAQDDLRQQHEQLRTLHAQLRDSEATREELVQMITHDLRGPLTGLLGALELIEDGSLGPLTSDQHQFIDQSLRNCQILNEMVTDILDVNRLEAGHTELDCEPVDLRALADLACTQVQAAITGKKLALINAIAPDLPPAWADRGKLVRVLANLLNNAFKYTERGAITVHGSVVADNGQAHAAPGEGQPTEAGRQYLLVEVWDTGVGIPDEARPQVFQKFFRVRNRRAAGVARGTGLGLYFCKHVVEAHCGNIWVDARPDGAPGSVFAFTVPLAPEPHAPQAR